MVWCGGFASVHDAWWGLLVPHGMVRGTLGPLMVPCRVFRSLTVPYGVFGGPLRCHVGSLGPLMAWCGGFGCPLGIMWGFQVPSWCHVGSLGPSWHGVGSSGLSPKFTTDRVQHGSVANFCDRSPLAASPCPSSHPRSPLVLDAGFPPVQMCRVGWSFPHGRWS